MDLQAETLNKLLTLIDGPVEEVEPFTDEEVAEIEAVYGSGTYTTEPFSPERERRHRMQLEQLRQEWIRQLADHALTRLETVDEILAEVAEWPLPSSQAEQALANMQASLIVLVGECKLRKEGFRVR